MNSSKKLFVVLSLLASVALLSTPLRAQEQKYLLAIKGELNNNLEAIHKEQARLVRALEAQRNLLALMEAEADTVSEQYLSTLITQSFSSEITLAYEQGVFTELLSAGGLRDISNDSIKSQIRSWEGKMRNVRAQEAELALYRNTITQYLIDHADLKTIFSDPTFSALAKDGKSKRNNSNKPLLKDQTFENFLMLYSVLGQVAHKSFYPELETNINYLLKLVEHELKKQQSK
jgi:hypothetical protein